MTRSILAVIVGYLTMAVAIIALFAISFRQPDAAPTQTFMLLSLVYALFAALAGGYVTALIARRKELKHTIALATFAALMGIVSMIVSAGQEPLWYQIANIAVMVPAVLLGGYLRASHATKANRSAGQGL